MKLFNQSLPRVAPWCSGPVAQLGARFHGMEEVVGSNPTRSTIFSHTNSSRRNTANPASLDLRLFGRLVP